jgi:hypothetical protein
MSKDEVLGYVDMNTLKVDDTGIFVERVLNRHARYMSRLETLIDAGMVGTSSQAVTGKSKRLSNGEITDWPLMRDTLTFTPAEPRMLMGNTLKAARELYREFPESKSLSIVEDVNSIKTLTDSAKTIKDIERLLRDAGGFSRAEAQTLVACIKSLSLSDSETKTTPAEIAAIFQRFPITQS